ncbi:MAG: AAA family ATPase [Cyanobacteria bacterium CRU_2_1]|nr:AAA family ATPase [Cyanobacteria bacterium CRU_2_1]
MPDLLTSNQLFGLASPPRGGKSLWCMLLAKSIATGQNFLDRPVSKGSVLYVNLEDSEAKIRERVEAQQWSQGFPIYWLDRFKLSELPMLAEICDEIDPRLIIWDTLSRIRDSSISESSAEMSQVLEPLQNLCQEKGCTGLLVHHTGKVTLDNAGTIEVFDTIRGSSAIRAVCRGVLILAASDRKYRLAVESGWGKHDLDVLLDANTMQWKLLGNWAGATVDLSQKDRALEYLNQVGSATIEPIAEATNLPKALLYKVLSRLQSDDMVKKEGSRKQALYMRTRIGPIGQSDSLSNSSKAEGTCNRGTIGQKIFCISQEKVIIEGKSDHPTPTNHLNSNNSHAKDDHFSDSQKVVQKSDNPLPDKGFNAVCNINDTKPLERFPVQDSRGDDHFSMITPPTLEKVVQ